MKPSKRLFFAAGVEEDEEEDHLRFNVFESVHVRTKYIYDCTLMHVLAFFLFWCVFFSSLSSFVCKTVFLLDLPV